MILHGIWETSPFPHLERCLWELVECLDCGQVFHKRVLNEEWEALRHARWMTGGAMERFEEAWGLRQPLALFSTARGEVARILCFEKMTRSLRQPGEAVRLVDFGCGWGRLVTMANLFGFEAVGIDRSDARRAGHQGGLGTIFASLEAFQEGSPKPAHAVALREVLEHLTAPLAVLRALHRIMVPSAVLLLEVPDATGIRRIEKDRDLVVDGIDHLNAFTPTSLTNLAKRAGFRRVKPPIPQVTADLRAVVKREARRAVEFVGGRVSTQQYFRRV